MTQQSVSRTTAAVALAFSCLWGPAFASPALESEPTLPGSALVKPPLLSGPLHRLADPVPVKGHLGTFVVESKFGTFTVRGASLLATRVHELQAIEALNKVQADSAFTEALAKSAAGVAGFAASAVDDPRKVVESVGAGAGTVLGRVGQVAKIGAGYAADKAADLAAPSGAAAPAQLPTGEPEPPAFIGDPFGYNKARRDWAKRLNVDPYSANPVLKPLLDRAASATFAGNFAVNLAVSAVAGPVQYAYSFDETVRDSVWNIPAIDLQARNEKALVALGVPARTIRDLQRNKWFTPTFQTVLTAHLGAMGRLEGMESVVKAAAATQGEWRVRFLLDSLALLAAHHGQTPFARLRMSQLVPAGVTRDGAVVAAVAIDYGSWDADAADFARRKDLAAKGRTLLVAGQVSPLARRELEKAGWKVLAGLRP